MDGELFRTLYHELFHRRKLKTASRCNYQDAVILWIYFLGVFSDRSSHWAHDQRHWPLWARHLPRPSYSQLMRRLKTPAIQAHMDELNQAIIRRLPTATEKAIDGKPLVVSEYTKDPDAKVGCLSAQTFRRGYKLHAIVNKHGVIEAACVTGLNASESTVAQSLIPQIDWHGNLLRGDANYDSSALYAAVADAGGRFVAPRRKPKRGLGHRSHHPDRRRAIAEFEHSADGGREHRRHRLRIEQSFGHLTNLPFGLAPLPNWVRRQERVERWVKAKIVLYHLNLVQKYQAAQAA